MWELAGESGGGGERERYQVPDLVQEEIHFENLNVYIYWIDDERLSWIPLLFILEMYCFMSWETLFEMNFCTIS